MHEVATLLMGVLGLLAVAAGAGVAAAELVGAGLGGVVGGVVLIGGAELAQWWRDRGAVRP
ncbi:hypothetical protein O7622_01185 [Micromonospora sp. WMMD1076]|uniref:hypothetical protein n=1 Tax=Micromonospora sp. WMMD1076 TaxID=3016103 RepID=UPI00249C2B57|nr:hypothetical protein [Micromonospora sp. WMMD1076]WFF07244.1 hypothetical protein O7622_01185 [Micromonospora sp. WMMD1076]